MRKTIQTGSAFEQPPQTSGGAHQGGSSDPGATAPHGTLDLPPAVRALPSPVPAAATGSAAAAPSGMSAEQQTQLRAALADTQQDFSRESLAPAARVPRSAKLGRTLRMEIKLGSLPAPVDEPEVSAAGRSPSEEPEAQPLIFGSTQRVGERKTGEFVSSRPALSSTNPLPNFRGPYEFGTSSRNSSLPPNQPRRRELRPGERTLILTRRKSSTRDWLFVVLLVGALGVTASMLLSYRNQSADPEEAATEETSGEAATEDSTLQSTTNESTARATETAPQVPAANSASEIQATELRSLPAGAEVAVGGAVVGNTPVRVARLTTDIDYTLRLPGYDPQVVRVGSQSPASIAVTLHRTYTTP